jgi:hypothetical protein
MLKLGLFLVMFREFKKYILRLGIVVTSIIPALRRLRQEDLEFKASLGYIESLRPPWGGK